MNDFQHAFPGQKADEPVFIFARRYPIAFLGTAAIFIFVALFSLLCQFIASTGFLAELSQDSRNLATVTLGGFQLLALIVFMVAVFEFYFDIIVVTDRRLVDIDQEQLFFRRISELALEDVQDVSSQSKGFLATIFNYGQVEVQTSGTRTNFLLEDVYAPREIATLILELKDQAREKSNEGERFPRSDILGVINNKPVYQLAEMVKLGAISEQEAKRASMKDNSTDGAAAEPQRPDVPTGPPTPPPPPPPINGSL